MKCICCKQETLSEYKICDNCAKDATEDLDKAQETLALTGQCILRVKGDGVLPQVTSAKDLQIETLAEIREMFEAMALNTEYKLDGKVRYAIVPPAKEGSNQRAYQEGCHASYPQHIKRVDMGHESQWRWQLTNEILKREDVWTAFMKTHTP